jgi:hypothetical protein
MYTWRVCVFDETATTRKSRGHVSHSHSHDLAFAMILDSRDLEANIDPCQPRTQVRKGSGKHLMFAYAKLSAVKPSLCGLPSGRGCKYAARPRQSVLVGCGVYLHGLVWGGQSSSFVLDWVDNTRVLCRRSG